MSSRATQPALSPRRRSQLGSERRQARILQRNSRPESVMSSSLRLSSPPPAPTGARRSARSAEPRNSAPPSRDSAAPASGRSASSAPLDYTDEHEETRVRQT